MLRRRGHLLLGVAMAVVAVVTSSCSSGGGGSNAVISQIGGSPETSSLYPGALIFPRTYAKPDVVLTDTENQPFNVATATRDQLTLVYFGYTHCPDLCPLNMFTTATAISRLPKTERSEVHVVFITTDPRRDSPTVIRTWLNHFAPSFIGLTGSVQSIEQAESGAGIPLSFAEHVTAPGASYEVVHAGYVLAYTQDNKAHLEFPAEIRPSQEAHDLMTLLRHGWRS